MNIINAIKKIYPNIQGGYGYAETDNGVAWQNPIDGLHWESKEYPKPTWEQIQKVLPIVELEEAKEKKLKELEDFHASDKVKLLKIIAGDKETNIFLTQDYRFLIDEQIKLLELRKFIGETNPTWTYFNGISLTLDYNTLVRLRVFIGQMTDHNFKAFKKNENQIKNTNNLKVLSDFKVSENYRINEFLKI